MTPDTQPQRFTPRESGGVKIDYFPDNADGTDFVVGDPHGCRLAVLAGLRQIGFNFQTDRLFIVGDLIDRGPDSQGTVELLDHPRVFAIQGNHEDMAIQALGVGTVSGQPDPSGMRLWRYNGGSWVENEILSHDPPTWSDRLVAVGERIRDLPHIAVIGTGTKRINLVHAEIPPQIGDADIDDGFAKHPGQITPETLMWSRMFMRSALPLAELNDLPRRNGLSPTVCGHTPRSEGPVADASHINIDTGAFAGGGLTFLNLRSGDYLTVPTEQGGEPEEPYAI